MMHNSKAFAPDPAQKQPSLRDNPCMQVVRMNAEGMLPEGFPYEQACDDKHFAQLCSQYGSEAAIAIYQLEQERDDAMASAREEAQQTLKRRSAMPAQRRANAPLSGDVDCWQMSDEEFRAYDQAVERQLLAARNRRN